MQNITVNYKKENDELIEQLPINFVDVVALLNIDYERNKKKYPWLCSIDPYGDTVFNSLQWPYLISEFIEFEKEVKDEKVKNILLNLIAFLKKNENAIHTHLKFIGD